jgi:hypothetical protein
LAALAAQAALAALAALAAQQVAALPTPRRSHWLLALRLIRAHPPEARRPEAAASSWVAEAVAVAGYRVLRLPAKRLQQDPESF